VSSLTLHYLELSTSKNESVGGFVPTYPSNVGSGVTMRDSCTLLTDRQFSDPAPPNSDIADIFVSQNVCDPKQRVEINPYNSPV
jgi:hypothetical protein